MKKQHDLELEDQKEEYGKLFREESSKWKLQREELENEIIKLKKMQNLKTTSNSNSQAPIRAQEADLTAIIKDLKESSDLLHGGVIGNNSKPLGKRTTSSNTNSQRNMYNSNVNSDKFCFWN